MINLNFHFHFCKAPVGAALMFTNSGVQSPTSIESICINHCILYNILWGPLAHKSCEVAFCVIYYILFRILIFNLSSHWRKLQTGPLDQYWIWGPKSEDSVLWRRNSHSYIILSYKRPIVVQIHVSPQHTRPQAKQWDFFYFYAIHRNYP